MAVLESVTLAFAVEAGPHVKGAIRVSFDVHQNPLILVQHAMLISHVSHDVHGAEVQDLQLLL
eukprot:CAMPEP_0202389708 /NCGR_PEP_ID=MMETSP1127-20130417/84649_1 /ASSEMBLY_ACC=CAM_ASM_000462 /TAXON_ID=3047 /ORGANISM="Dunaliella tertiolecta, Strain CCMP1320" /LENGTH=62 /DNA_ID=CAMNT_0048991561 /DNA_START=68 /DNA_END=252 /DNA_ORIENTATION=+